MLKIIRNKKPQKLCAVLTVFAMLVSGMLFANSNVTKIKADDVAATVSTFAELQAAIANPDIASVCVTNNIIITDTLVIDGQSKDICTDSLASDIAVLSRGPNLSGPLISLMNDGYLTLNSLILDGNRDNMSVVVDSPLLLIDGGYLHTNINGYQWYDDPALVLRNNSSTSDGGAIKFQNGALSLLYRVVISNNHSDGDGGGMYVENSWCREYQAVDMINNTAGRDGGGMYVDRGGFSSYYGDTTYSTFGLRDGTIYGNTADRDGGGAFIKNTDMQFEYSDYYNNHDRLISNNTAGRDGGGLKIVGDTYSPEIRFSGNTTDDSGHAVYNIFQNIAGRDGGGMYLDGVELLYSNTRIGYNSANGNGGGMYVRDFLPTGWGGNNSFPMFAYNSAHNGGAIYYGPNNGLNENQYYGYVLPYAHAPFVGNTAANDGGAMYVSAQALDDLPSGGGLMLAASPYSDGSCVMGAYDDSIEFQDIPCPSFINNTASRNGGAIYLPREIFARAFIASATNFENNSSGKRTNYIDPRDEYICDNKYKNHCNNDDISYGADDMGYAVAFDAQGGSATDSEYVYYGDMISEPAAPVRDGYEFKGWQTTYRPSCTTNIEEYEVWVVWGEGADEDAPNVVIAEFMTEGEAEYFRNAEYGWETLPRLTGDITLEVTEREVEQCTGVEAEMASSFDFNAKVYGNFTLYATWESLGSDGNYSGGDSENESSDTGVPSAPNTGEGLLAEYISQHIEAIAASILIGGIFLARKICKITMFR